MKHIHLLAVVSAILCIIIGCNSFNAVKPTTPIDEAGYTTLPFKKIINPAFAEDAGGKWVRCKVRYRMQNDATVMSFLPSQYQSGYVGFNIYDVDDPTAWTYSVVIPKAKSDIIFDLKTGDIVEIFAYLVPTSSSRGPGILFDVEKVQRSK